MPKNNRHGQAAPLTEFECAKIRRELKGAYRLIWDIARWTGERWGAVIQLKVEDVYFNPELNSPHQYITFRACTRKGSPDGTHQTRQVPVHPILKEILELYKLPSNFGLLFPSSQNPELPLTLRGADLALRFAVGAAGLEHKGISTHSTRVSFITGLHNKGVSVRVIQQLTGHKNPQVLAKYIVVSDQQAKAAIALL